MIIPVPDSERITACIVCRNEADRLGPCLESAAWAEIVVLDMESTDGSAALARAHGAKVVTREPVPIVELVRNEVAALAVGDWVLVLDPDERVTPGLARALQAAAARDDVDAVVVPRMNLDFGYPPSHPLQRFEPQLRMYRRSRVSWPAAPNLLPIVPEAQLHRIPARDDLVLVHDRSRTVAEVIERVLRYAPAQGRAMFDAGQVFTARRMLLDLGRRSERYFVEAEAFHDGVPGLLRAGLRIAFHFYAWAAFWQASGARRTPEDDRLLRRLGTAVEGASRVGRATRATYARSVGALRRRAPD